MKEPAFIDFDFNYASISLKPYTGDNGTSTQLLKKIFLKLNEKNFPSEKRIIDRHENRKNGVSRKLVFISSTFEPGGGKRCFGKIALIKNKAPMLWGGKDVIEEIEKEENKKFIEITNYSVHFNSDSDPVIMYEFNSEGPRLSDIEYYIRHVAKEFRLAKFIQTIIHLKIDISQIDKQIINVFGVTVKVNSAFNLKYDWLTPLKTLNDDSGYKDVRLEFFYSRRKDQKGKYERNIRGTDFARRLVSWLQKDKTNIDYLDDLKMSYQIDEQGEILDLDFLKNKVVSNLHIPLSDGKIYKPSIFKHIVGQEFNKYLKTGVATENE